MSDGNIRVVFDAGNWLPPVAALFLVLAFLLYRRTLPPLSRGRRALLLLFRASAVLLLVVFLADPSLVTMRVERRPPIVGALVDVSRSMGIADEGERTRLDAALEALGGFRDELRARSDAELRVIPFAGDLGDDASGTWEHLTATGEGSDIVGAVDGFLERNRSSAPAALLLLSDGRITRGMVDPERGVTVPVFAVAFGDSVEPPDVAVERVEAERTVYRGTRTGIEATLSISGFPDRDVPVTLLDGAETLARTVVRGSGAVTATLAWTPSREGERQLTVRAGPIVGETRLGNNEEEIAVAVRKERIRVLVADRYADWNATLLRRLGDRSPRFEVEVAIWMPGRGYRLLGANRAWHPGGDLDVVDVLFVSDETGMLSDPVMRSAMAGWVRRGGGLALLADERSFLLAKRNGGDGLIPVRPTGAPRVESGEFHVAAAPATRNAFARAFGEIVSGSDLPPLPLRLGGLEPTAGAESPLVFDGDGRPFLALQRTGAGVTAAVLGYPLWRWALAGDEGALAFDRFFGGLIQFLAGGGDAAFEVRSARASWTTGEAVRLVAETNGGRTPGTIRGLLEQTGSATGTAAVSAFLFSPVEGRDGRFEAVLDPLSPGTYLVTATDDDGETAIEAQVSFSVRPVSVEFLRIAGDRGTLARIAGASGGALIDRDLLYRLPARLSLDGERVTRRDVRPLRAEFLLFASIVALLAAEWTLRKAWGLV